MGLSGSLANDHPYKASSISQPVVTVDSVGSTSGTASINILESGGANVTVDYYYGSSDKGRLQLVGTSMVPWVHNLLALQPLP